MVNLNKFENLRYELDLALAQLRELALIERDAFLLNPVQIGAARYYLQTAIEACGHLGKHFAVSEGYRTPADEVDVWLVLSEHNVIPYGFATTLKQMVDFQQRLMHRPWEVDDHDVHNILQNHLDDFDLFKRHLASFINPEPAAE